MPLFPSSFVPMISISIILGKKASEAKRRASGDALSMREDEMAMNLKKRRAREEANAKFDSLVKKSITDSKRESMQSQDLLRAKMQNAYKQGASSSCFFSLPNRRRGNVR